MKGLCGRKSCNHLCSRSIYCRAGQERVSLLLFLQRQRREAQKFQLLFFQQRQRRKARKFQQDIENAIPVFAGSFKAFQSQLQWEREQLASEQIVIEGEPGFTYDEYLENYKESEVI